MKYFNEVATLLIKYNADVNIQNNLKATPLHIAAMHDEISIVETLLANKADVTLKDVSGHEPSDLSTYYKFI